jgi:hypothetical protein
MVRGKQLQSSRESQIAATKEIKDRENRESLETNNRRTRPAPKLRRKKQGDIEQCSKGGKGLSVS